MFEGKHGWILWNRINPEVVKIDHVACKYLRHAELVQEFEEVVQSNMPEVVTLLLSVDPSQYKDTSLGLLVSSYKRNGFSLVPKTAKTRREHPVLFKKIQR